MTPLRILLDKKGFTLTEAMVVTAIVIIMVGMGHSGFSSLQRREMGRAAAYQLSGQLKEARMRAIEKHASHAVVFNGSQYTICHQASADFDCKDEDGDITLYSVDMAQEYPDVTLALNGLTALRFDTRGIPRKQGGLANHTITVNRNGSGVFDIKISSLGRIRIDEK